MLPTALRNGNSSGAAVRGCQSWWDAITVAAGAIEKHPHGHVLEGAKALVPQQLTPSRLCFSGRSRHNDERKHHSTADDCEACSIDQLGGYSAPEWQLYGAAVRGCGAWWDAPSQLALLTRYRMDMYLRVRRLLCQ